MKIHLLKIFLPLLLWLAFVQPVFAEPFQIPARPQAYVNDYAHMLNPEDIARLNAKLRVFDQQTSNQIVVATFDSLNGESLEEFSIHLVQAWKIGTKQHDNGVLLLIIKDSHDIRIEVGYGLEGVLTDAVSSMIIRQDMVPSFKQGNYAQGIENGVQSIMQVTQGEYKGTGASSQQNNNAILSFILIFLLLHFLSAAFRYNNLRGTSEDHGWRTFLLFLLLTGGSGRGGAGRSDDDNDDGFSGGGGGFGGGGASGKW
ncbi:MAG: hypothetical protein K0S08_791 [Gammaproteobacteria bacterium]|jgi:uncharacterized protein|nr:hypothetical protein [Gammaproteobacteria bacterium]